MHINSQLYLDDSLPAEAIRALEAQTGIQAQVLGGDQKDDTPYTADAVVELIAGGHSHHYIVECKRNVDRKSLVAQVKAQPRKNTETILLIAPYVSREIAEYCREIDLQFIDTHGNAYLSAPGMYVYIKGEKDLAGKTAPRYAKGITNPTALRILFVLLCRPAMLQASYRQITESAGVSLGAISATFEDLKKRGLLLGAERGHGRKLLEPQRLVEEWVLNYSVALRPKLNPRRFSSPDPHWWRDVDVQALHAVWGGEVAAERLTNYLRPATQTLYVTPEAISSCLQYLVRKFRLKPDPFGEIEILEKFWNFPLELADADIAPALLVYADLMATFEPRNAEVAQIIKGKLFDAALHPD